jgi:hypothetical protein
VVGSGAPNPGGVSEFLTDTNILDLGRKKLKFTGFPEIPKSKGFLKMPPCSSYPSGVIVGIKLHLVNKKY